MALGSRTALIIEDDRLMASLIADLLSDHGFECVVAHTATEAKRALKASDVDVAVIDIRLGAGPSGVQVATAVEKTHPGVGIVFLTNTPEYISLEVKESDLPSHFAVAGKDRLASGEELLDAVESVLVANRSPVRHDTGKSSVLASLIRHQREVLHDVAAGLTNHAIATKRGVTTRSVERTLQNVFQRLGIPDSDTTNRRAVAIRHYVEAAGFPPRQ
jgi:DNA-binding NarL/FixJ family response regulator